MNPKELFQEVWDRASRRVNSGKHSRDSVTFFLTDGTSKRFDIRPMRGESDKDEFVRLVCEAINNYSVEAVMVSFECWFVSPKITTDQVSDYLKNNPRPSKDPNKKEGISFYFEKADGTMFNSLAEIKTIKKGKRVLEPLPELSTSDMETKISHLFKKAREYALTRRSVIDDILRSN